MPGEQPATFDHQVRDALGHLHDPGRLQLHPLARARPAGRDQSGAGRALQRDLREAIEALRPGRGGRARGHDLLTLRYVEGLDAAAVQARLGIAHTEYFREQARAVAAVAALLRERWGAAPPGPAPAPVDGPVGRLPVSPTTFVGREQEVAELVGLLGSARLVTLTGAGGVGKTRLALRVATELGPRHPDGVWFVALAPLADERLVPLAALAALGVHEAPGRAPLAVVAEHLRERDLLVVLDNCEHLVQAAAELADALVDAGSGVRVLATSRGRLGVAGEVVWRVPSLTTPDPGQAEPPAVVARYAAVRLFADRARAAERGWALTAANAPAVAAVCRRLDGLPLAIELAAARVPLLTVEQIADRLGDRFRLLTGGSRTALPRHRTLRALIDWSYDLLSASERTFFSRLAVFAGGFTLEAASAVCGQVGAGPPAPAAAADACLDARDPSPGAAQEALDLVGSLVDRSLVLTEHGDGGVRYRLLETLRQYAREKLDESGETPAARAAHAAYFAAWAGGPGPQSVAPATTRTVVLPLGPLADEADNLRAALGCFLDRGDAEAGLALAARVHHLWFLRGPRAEGRAWLARLLALPAPVPPPSRAAAVFAAGWLAQFQGDLADARAAYTEAATLAEARGDRAGRAYAQTQLGVVALLRGEPARARLEESARLAREVDAPAALLESLVNLGFLAVAQGDLARAGKALAEGRAVLPRFPYMGFRFRWLAGDLALAEGQPERAARAYRAALANRWATGDPVGVAISALALAEVAASAGQGTRAARLLGGSEGIAMHVGDRPVSEIGRWPQHARVEGAARELLGEATFAALRAEGRRLSLEDVVQLAQQEPDRRALTDGEEEPERL